MAAAATGGKGRDQGAAPRRPLVPSLTPAVVTTRGRRETNQDRVCALRTLVGGEPAVLLAVADGIGGLAAGEQAAELAVQEVCDFAHHVIPRIEPGPESLRRGLGDLLRGASRRIWEWGSDSGVGGAGGSTLVCALVWDRHYLVAHAGDSRCYYVNDRGASALTVDHTEAARLVRAGDLEPQRASGSPLRHRLTNALGWPAALVVDFAPAAEDLGTLDEDCALVLCSDGLHATVGETDLHRLLHETRALDEACRRLVALALDRGSSDNVSVAAVEVGRLRRREPGGLGASA
ncbi:MAG TPA: protein phosphatase 2C domain-containing protein [Vicinamibacteria bacterium]|nr:protein phosphatase 2C domain-containing protein [Vicinamibacteria bacterium]